QLLPASFSVFGFARSAMDDDAFRTMIASNLSCRYSPGATCEASKAAFLEQCFYVSGHYGSRDSFLDLYERQRTVCPLSVNHLFYLATPPSVFLDVARALGGAGLVHCGFSSPWSRIVIEKPFGRDRESSDVMVREMGLVFREAQTFRIDHYLGKEVIQNLMVLRFANLVFEPLWNRQYIDHVQISWKEDLSVAGRGGYFDNYGIIRDVMQNHLLQILALVAMEPASELDAGHICNEKIRVLRSIKPVGLDDLVVGQYRAAWWNGRHELGYLEDEGVPENSLTPTYAAACLAIDNERWRGVPFLIRAGKGLETRTTEIRIRFKPVERSMFAGLLPAGAANELVIRVQPDEAIYLQVATKVPGMAMKLQQTPLNLRYQEAFDAMIPDAYESLLVDVMRGDKSLFIRKDELAAAWDIFTPVLKDLEQRGQKPESYAFGTVGPDGAQALAARSGVVWG
ncbi:MAG TPA: glucose-6-phosphate dehydrogenase, partial [Verrucomicrobia bacterium]|nr:glucose-6-phosphate dehydrogenase [Verrucomicrobiota bacterium]